MSARLHVLEAGPSSGTPLVLLHGFGGYAESWNAVIHPLADRFRILAFDLPGHAGSLDYPAVGSPRAASIAVLNELKLSGIDKAHVAGHSMGGAVAALIALDQPNAVASLTLVAPGGFGPEMDGLALQAFADAMDIKSLTAAYANMMAGDSALDPSMIENLLEIRTRPGQGAALQQILVRITRGNGQGELPLDALQKARFPATLVWGSQDRIVPFSQSANAPDFFKLVALEGRGHMLLDEAPGEVAAAIAAHLANPAQVI